MLLDGSVLPTFAWEEQGAEAAALTLSQFRFMAAFFLSLPVAWLFRFVPTVRGRHLYALLTGFALIYYPFGNGCFHAFISSGATYLIMWRFRDHAATLAWLVDFMYLIGCHVSSASGQAWKQGQMDFTGAQMVLTLKIISAAACYQDGAKPAAELRPYQESMKLHLMPSLLEFFSYVFAAGNLLAGPFFEFRDYIEYIERKGAWAVAKGKRLPSGGASGLFHLGKALICMVVHLRFVPHFPVELLESRWHSHQPFLERLLLLYIVPTVYRFKYYFAWGIAETGLILSGLNFNGYTDSGKARWDRYINTHIRKVELCPSAAQLPQHWNICTGLFLRQYVYERLTVKGKKPTFVTLIITQIVSGIWHGLFAGYALFFVSVAFAIQASKVLFRYERNWPSWLTNALPWTALKCVLTALLLNYSAGAFLILEFSPSIAIWRSVGFIGHWTILTILLVGIVSPPRKPAGDRSQKQSGKATAFDVTSPADGKANPASGTPSAPSVVDARKSA